MPALAKIELDNIVKEIDGKVANDEIFALFHFIKYLIETYTPTQLDEILPFLLKDEKTRLAFGKCCKENDFGKTLFSSAIQNKKNNVINAILNLKNVAEILEGTSPTLLFDLNKSAMKGNVADENLLFEILDKGMKINSRHSIGATIIHQSLMRRNPEVFFRLFKQYEAKIDFSIKDHYQSTLLHFAAQYTDSTEAVKILLQKGVDPKAKDMYGKTAFDWAMAKGNIKVAQLLSNKTEAQLRKDPRFKFKFDEISHGDMIENLSKFLKGLGKVGDTRYPIWQAVSGGICNGWSFAAALHASEGDKALAQFYKKCALLSDWDGRSYKLTDPNQVPVEFRKEYKNLNEIFLELTNELLTFYHQGEAYIGVARNDRVRQLQLVSDKSKIVHVMDFGLSDLTEEEHAKVLSAFQPLLNNCIVDAYNFGHDMTYFQDANGNSRFLDPNAKLILEKNKNYSNIIDNTRQIREGMSSLCFFHTKPEMVTHAYLKQLEDIQQKLIKELVLDNPERMKKIDFDHIAFAGLPVMLKAFLQLPQLNAQQTPQSIAKQVDTLALRNNFQCLYVYHQENLIDLSQQGTRVLEALLKTAYLYDDKKLEKAAKNAIEEKLKGEEKKQFLQSLLDFNLDFSKKEGVMQLKPASEGLPSNEKGVKSMVSQYESHMTREKENIAPGKLKPNKIQSKKLN